MATLLARWYLQRQLRTTWPTNVGTVTSATMLIHLAQVRQLVFPTLRPFYQGEPLVRQFFAVHDQTLATKQRVLQVAASIAAPVEQPFFQAVTRAARESGLDIREAEVDQVSPVGFLGRLDRTWYLLGDEACLQGEDIEPGVSIQTLARQFEQEGQHVLYLAQKQPKRLLGIFACAYPLRPEGAKMVTELRELGVEAVLVTDVAPAIARGISRHLGISLLHSGTSSQEKGEVVRALFIQQPASAMVVDQRVPASLLKGKKVIHLDSSSASEAAVPSLIALPELIHEAQLSVQKFQKRFFWIKL